MRKLFTFALILIFALAIGSVASAQGPNGVEGTTGVQVANLSSASVTVATQYIAEDGTVYTLPDQIIPVDGSYTYYAEPGSNSTPAGPASFKGAVIASADGEIAAIAKTEWSFAASGAAAYSSASAGATSVILPLIVVDHYGTNAAVTVQNTTDAAANVTLSFTSDAGTFTKPMSIEGGASTSMVLGFDADFIDPDTSAAGWVGSAVVTSDDGSSPVVAVVHIDNGGNFVYAYNGFTDVTQTVNFLPLIRNDFSDLFTGVQVAETSGTAGSVEIAYNGYVDANQNFIQDAGEEYACTDSSPITSGGSVLFFSGGDFVSSTPSGDDCAQATGLPQYFLGNAKVTASGGANIVTVVNDQATNFSTSSAYNGFFGSDASEKVLSPLARAGFANFVTGLQIQNIGATDATVTYSMVGYVDYNGNFLQDSGEEYSCSETASVIAGASATFVPGIITPSNGDCVTNSTTNAALDDFLGSATFEVTGGSLVGITNDQSLTGSGDTAIFNMNAVGN